MSSGRTLPVPERPCRVLFRLLRSRPLSETGPHDDRLFLLFASICRRVAMSRLQVRGSNAGKGRGHVDSPDDHCVSFNVTMYYGAADGGGTGELLGFSEPVRLCSAKSADVQEANHRLEEGRTMIGRSRRWWVAIPLLTLCVPAIGL